MSATRCTLVNSIELHAAFLEIIDDERWSYPSMERYGDCYRRAGSVGLGYQFPHCRTVRGKVRYNENDEGWFVAVTINGCTTNVRLGIIGRTSYQQVADAAGQLIELSDTQLGVARSA